MDTRTSVSNAKQPRTVLAGPYGHPFHPILVTIPIGTWSASLVFDIIALFVDDPTPFLIGAQVLIAIGVLGALAAAVLGLLDYSIIPAGTHAKQVATRHMALNLGAVVIFAIDFFVRLAAGADDVQVLPIVLSVVGLLGIGLSGYLGGELAYRYGVRVADEETQAKGFRRDER